MHLLEHCIRKDLDVNAKRTMTVLEPILGTIINLEKEEEVEVNDFPKFPEKGKHKIKLTK